ncbi:enoyl-CoA hydratase/isomerase family protein [Mesorhizobium sp. Z1-4]|uniref:enoyl-CoA hydratase/isomerase family protein n=1 Tax=Mesorhizobium sp. Z1-4 TaxID=2448478 RepID=UPI000FD8978D|nr:enoyl-CoA hydratase/isomerase family protein [Mesorhizobium sp. Z1-4]
MFRYEKSDGVAVLTLDNPPVNVLTPELHEQLYGILKDFYSDPEVRCGIWTGAGERAYCAGDDVKSVRQERTTAEIVDRHLTPRRSGDTAEYPGWETEILSLRRTKPMIAAVNGPCMGQGMIYLLLLTDLRIAVPGARFGMPEIAYGMPGAGGVTRLGRQIPQSAALWMALTGEAIDAEEARRCFLINEIVDPGKLMARAGEIAGRIASLPPRAVRVEMETFYRALDLDRDNAMALAGHMYHLVRATFDKTPPLAAKEK